MNAVSIITINRNNASGLKKTMQSVLDQSFKDYEYVVVDGASTDGSVDVIKDFIPLFGERMKWISEPDNGIYNAMNKGIQIASGDYIQFLNSGDALVGQEVEDRMYDEVNKTWPSIIYGNMIKCFPDGRRVCDKCFAGQEITLFGMYRGTLNHDPAWIKREMFEKYGYYDEKLKIVSDWKWYLQAIVIGKDGVEPLEPTKIQYVDMDVTMFDMTGISETNLEARDKEKRRELESLLDRGILRDYDTYGNGIDMIRRLQRHKWAYQIVWFTERVLFKIEKMSNKGIQKWG